MVYRPIIISRQGLGGLKKGARIEFYAEIKGSYKLSDKRLCGLLDEAFQMTNTSLTNPTLN